MTTSPTPAEPAEPTAEKLDEAKVAELDAETAVEAAKLEVAAETKAETAAKADKPKSRRRRSSADASDEAKESLHAAAAEILGIYESEVLAVDEVDDDVVATTVDGQRYQLHGSARGEFTWLKKA